MGGYCREGIMLLFFLSLKSYFGHSNPIALISHFFPILKKRASYLDGRGHVLITKQREKRTRFNPKRSCWWLKVALALLERGIGRGNGKEVG